ncbi:Oxidoreductase 2OG-Fe(II) oxygenase family [Penicillium chermesinum]|uniref:Oxidoreductase 2OG-Fe(II) oxygenase family n=1 Tax=Penicillium chermesinum TaxID=63820 RepID=A0A9W9NII4_9EURO|nr:Oxidoreductase 2OG-Fe(II) oxygenase family [Penicillium chermesinum]KAJ5220378.1 Oxidoreductase 2OG-Fe(II) oxygenase family [Penicillium chermesinum]
MASNFDQVISLQGDGLEVQGLLKRRTPSTTSLPLVVFIHGGGANAAYFDNSSYSYPRVLSEQGHNVLNIQRAGYGGVCLPKTQTPLLDSVSLITKLIANVCETEQCGQGGVILVGHSMGGAIVLAIAAQSKTPFSILGVSALGVVPSPEKGTLLPDPDPTPSEPRYSIEDPPTVIKKFFGPFECLNEDVFTGDTLRAVFEPAHPRLWKQSCFEVGGHNYEFTKHSADLHELRYQFISKMVELPAPGPDEPLYRNICGPNQVRSQFHRPHDRQLIIGQWPDSTALPGFREAIENYIAQITNLSGKFTALIAEALDLPPNAFDEAFDNPQQHKLKLIKYPPPPPDHSEATGFQGVGPHKDSGFLTFLLQATPHHGLEVQNKAGDWISAPPIPDTFVINIGRALEAMTGGVCTATTHRVSLLKKNFVDSKGASLGARFSFPVFQGVSPDLSADKITLVVPQHIRDLVKDAKVKSDAEATFNQMFKRNLGEGTLVARVTSHQDVGQRWYPEILARALQGQKEYVA